MNGIDWMVNPPDPAKLTGEGDKHYLDGPPRPKKVGSLDVLGVMQDDVSCWWRIPQIMHELNLTRSAARHHLNRLYELGYVDRRNTSGYEYRIKRQQVSDVLSSWGGERWG